LDAKEIRSLVRGGKYEFSKHAERERESDMIFVWELESALEACTIIENYPDDRRGQSCLVLGFCGSRPIHAVCTIRANPRELLLITVYDPSKRPEKWAEDYTKRG